MLYCCLVCIENVLDQAFLYVLTTPYSISRSLLELSLMDYWLYILLYFYLIIFLISLILMYYSILKLLL